MLKERTIYDLQLHEEMIVTEELCVRRVPGGWTYMHEDSTASDNLRYTYIFVPYSDEFKPKEEKEKYIVPAPGIYNHDKDYPFQGNNNAN